MTVTRFAPSPTGFLHLGHAYSALVAQRAAAGGTFLLRLEDIDPVRCKPAFADAIFEDLRWLGLDWPEPVRIQSRHMNDYAAALDMLRGMGVLYPCFCTRKDIADEVARAGGAPHAGDGGVLYPGTCRHLGAVERAEKMAQQGTSNWRLDMAAACRIAGPLFWCDRQKGRVEARPEMFGDVVLARKDVPTSYHLSVTVDDHLQGVTCITRGEDLFASTHVHRLLQALLGYEAPDYGHHALILDATGRRYAKRDRAATLRALRESGVTAEQVLQMIPRL